MPKSQFEARFRLDINPRFVKQVADGVKEGMDRGMREIMRSAARLSPYRTGHNARMISYATSWGSGDGPLRNDRSALGSSVTDKGKHAAAIFTGSGYGGYLEVGTSRVGARPYIRPAVEMHSQYLLRSIRDAIKSKT